MTEREEFEVWFKKDFHYEKSGPYVKDMLFEAWQASRGSLAVEFTTEIELDLDGDEVKVSYQNAYAKGYNEAMRDIELKLNEAGIKAVSNGD